MKSYKNLLTSCRCHSKIKLKKVKANRTSESCGIALDNSYKPDLITLIDEDNVEHNFEILDTIENEKGVFYALYPIYDNAKDSVDDSGEYYIMEVIEEDGEEQLAEVQDESLLDELSAIFEKRFEELFDDVEEENKEEK